MKIYIQGFTVLLILMCGSAMAQEKIGENIMFTPIEHATLVIQAGEKTIYVDPVGDAKRLEAFPKPDIILITHIHHDHLSPSLVAAVKKEETVVIGPKSVTDQLGYGQTLKNGESTTVQGIQIEAIPAYNLTPDRLKFHPKSRGDNGYVLNLSGKRIYLSGDTEDIQEMRDLKNIDFAFVCMNLPYTMTVEQAASAVLEMKPKAVTPYHYRGAGGMSDLNMFKRLVEQNPDIEVRLLDWYGK